MMTKVVFVIAATTAMADGFAFDPLGAFKPNTALLDLSEKMGQKFKISMHIKDEKDKDKRGLALDGLGIELLHDTAPKDAVGMPGVDGPHPKTSTGAFGINVLSEPSFIDLSGTQKVTMEKAAWEVIFRKDAGNGALICGFNVPVGAKRNDQHLDPGRLYLSFDVYQAEKLAIRQAERVKAEANCKEYVQERDDELQKYATESNIFKKVMHYRNAAAAVEKIDFSGVRWLSSIPADSDVIPIGNGLLVNTKGTIWEKQSSFMGAQHTMLGEAMLSLAEEENALKP